jgi:hypothetical protein
MHRGLTFALYQATIAFGILLMPIALLVRRLGLSLPVNRLVEAAGTAYERTDTDTRTTHAMDD